jgi:hypothetical protein
LILTDAGWVGFPPIESGKPNYLVIQTLVLNHIGLTTLYIRQHIGRGYRAIAVGLPLQGQPRACEKPLRGQPRACEKPLQNPRLGIVGA